MRIKILNITLSVAAALLFLWFAFKSIAIDELWQQILLVNYYWLPFFIAILIFSHFIRAVRWRLLLPDQYQSTKSITLFAGVMLGYVVNNIIPRLGEISRPVYVSKKTGLKSGILIGTVVIERVFDLITMLCIAMAALFWLIKDLGTLERLLGLEGWSTAYYLFLPLLIGLLFFFIWIFYKLILYIDTNIDTQNPLLTKIITFGRSFSEGLISLKKVKNWPLFLFLTCCMWFGYILMIYIPFYMMQMQADFGLNFWDAVVLTVVSAVGVTIPTPAGIGSYHLLIQQSLYMLYEVPLAKGLTYATVIHAVTILTVFIVGPIALWWDKFVTMKKSTKANS
tara:strand:+ start:39859 stop:40872 length:1014 start_codon:yes stop_codon:yes gene_type:complete